VEVQVDELRDGHFGTLARGTTFAAGG
jgi:hypothetical protein